MKEKAYTKTIQRRCNGISRQQKAGSHRLKIGWVRCMKKGKASPKIEKLPKNGTRRLVIMDFKMVAMLTES